MKSLNTAMRWLRQLICIHGPLEMKYEPPKDLELRGVYATQSCVRCGKVIMHYVESV